MGGNAPRDAKESEGDFGGLGVVGTVWERRGCPWSLELSRKTGEW